MEQKLGRSLGMRLVHILNTKQQCLTEIVYCIQIQEDVNHGSIFYLLEAVHDPCADVTAKSTLLFHLSKLWSK